MAPPPIVVPRARIRVLQRLLPLTLAFFAITALLVIPPGALGNPHGMVGYAKTGAICHAPTPTPSVVPRLVGLPESYRAGETYRLSISIEGGPPIDLTKGGHAGGFDLRASVGSLQVLPGDTTVMLSYRGGSYHDMTQGMHQETPFPPETWGEATFTHEGANARSWSIDWKAPRSPGAGDVTFDLAVLAANGDHLNSSADKWNTASFVVHEGTPLPFLARWGDVVLGGLVGVVALGGAGFAALKLREKRKKQGRHRSAPPEARGAFVRCPHCGADMREANLHDHERRAHAGSKR